MQRPTADITTIKADDLSPLMEGVGGYSTKEPVAPTDIRNFVKLPVVTPSHIRQSSMSTVLTCMRMFLFRERLQLEPRGHRSAPYIGQMFHLALGARYAGLNELAVEQTVSRALEDYQSELTTWATETGHLEEASRAAAYAEEDALLAKAMALIHWTKFPLDGSKYRVHAIEKELEAKVGTIATPLGGRIDLLLEHLGTPRGFVLVDHKTISSDPLTWIQGVGYSSQVRAYRILASESIRDSGLPLLGVIHNVIRKPTIKRKSWQDFPTFLEECIDWYEARDDAVGTLDERGNPVVFKSGPRKGQPKPRWEHSDNQDLWLKSPPVRFFYTPFTEDLVPDEFYRKVAITSRAGRSAPTIGSYPTTGSDSGHCMNHYGRACPFLPLCSVDPDNWAGIVATQYQVRKPSSSPLTDVLPDDLTQE